MTWVKLDDGLPEHPKIALLNVRARWLYVRALCYAARYLTDGVIPAVIADGWEGRRYSRELVEGGLWSAEREVYVIHDYLDFNPSRAEVESRKRADTVRKSARNPDGIQTESERNPSGIRADASRAQDGTGSVGVEVGGGGPGGGGCEFDAFWLAYPRKVGKPKARSAFDAACRRAAAADVIAGAERYRDDPNRSDEFTAHPTTWLHRDGWNDPPLPSRNDNGHQPDYADNAARTAAALIAKGIA